MLKKQTRFRQDELQRTKQNVAFVDFSLWYHEIDYVVAKKIV